ncbi:haloacid dehalogenase [Leuconostoc litchii]|uniref:Haloacid dehalogenase n=1 Tax=Leuconostoc litchii TaxID=1981069 RepID=A0A6P2CPA2_9LACO|nr:haloacid dehalogenase [Leuconostoc litchii]TYC46032.1 haloacid dehalogenase [Leuconostoc litchii]GMA69894.1 haloacid dehalogenase [Leuconostoc litchii]
MTDQLYERAEEFHKMFDDRQPKQPKELNKVDLANRVGFILEELTELAASHCQSTVDIDEIFANISQRLDAAKKKLQDKTTNDNAPIVQQSDSLGDIIYLAYGSYVLMGIDPTHILEVIHSANMHKLFPDGTAHRDKLTNKVLKPDNWFENYQPEPKIKNTIDEQLKN